MIAMTYLLDDSEVIFISNLNPSQKKDSLQWKCIVSGVSHFGSRNLL